MSRLSPQVALVLALVAWPANAKPSKAPAGPGGDCLTCHDEYAKKKVVHPPVANGLCLACHSVASEVEHKFELAADGAAMCAQCHSTRSTQKVLHPPVVEGLCLTCHDPHASNFQARLRVSLFDTCTSCHPSKRMQVEASATPHGALDPQQNPRVCVSCHDPHQSDNEKRLVAWPVMNVCFQCHNGEQKLKTPAGDPLIDVAGWVGKHGPLERHGPVREGRCPDCHDPHGTSEWRMLKGPFPDTPYAPFLSPQTYGLCFRCHDQRLVTTQPLTQVKAVSNPDPAKDLSSAKLPEGDRLVRGGLTGFRNGDDNLHFRHVNKFDKGRPCRLCHDVHASENPKHLRTTTPFGNWEFKLNYKKTPTGGSCWPGCHVERKYDREQRQENPR